MRMHIRLPIQCSLLEMILFEVKRIFGSKGQVYLEALYLALFAIFYYGMMRISEVVYSDHVIKAKDVHSALNKDKLLLLLYSSKTHSKGSRPQRIKITSNLEEKSGFCRYATNWGYKNVIFVCNSCIIIFSKLFQQLFIVLVKIYCSF